MEHRVGVERRNVSLAGHPQAATQYKAMKRAPGLGESDLKYYGWRVVLAACVGVMAGFGSPFVYTFAVLVKPLSAEFGWSREAISSGFAIAAVTVGLCSPLLGRWIDRISDLSAIFSGLARFVCESFAQRRLLRRESSETP
jgi:hypothetical protein